MQLNPPAPGGGGGEAQLESQSTRAEKNHINGSMGGMSGMDPTQFLGQMTGANTGVQ